MSDLEERITRFAIDCAAIEREARLLSRASQRAAWKFIETGYDANALDYDMMRVTQDLSTALTLANGIRDMAVEASEERKARARKLEGR